MGWSEQRQYPRLGLGLPVTLLFLGGQFGGQARNGQVEAELQDISRGGCFFKSNLEMAIDKRISVVLSATGGKTCQASGRVVRTVAYKGFAVLFDETDTSALDELLRDLTPLPQESRAALLSTVLRPEIQIYDQGGNPERVPKPSREGLRRAEPGSVHAIGGPPSRRWRGGLRCRRRSASRRGGRPRRSRSRSSRS